MRYLGPMNKILSALTRPVLLPKWWQDLFLSIPRIVGGYLLTARFGSDKFGLPWSPEESHLALFQISSWFPEDVSHYGGIFASFPYFFAWMAGFSEAVGGIFLLLGLQTRLFGLLIALTMLGAMFLQQINEGLWNMLPAMGFLWVGLYAVVLGSGRFGVDYLLIERMMRKSV